MKIGLFTDAPRHNLALMKISAYHKIKGDSVFLNCEGNFDLTYGSWLFSNKRQTDVVGGPIYPEISLSDKFNCFPDYSLYPIDYSLGFTWKYCPRNCDFCLVGKQNNSKEHYSIHSFLNTNFSKIVLLNNNTFTDPKFDETFKEIWDHDLTVIDQNGYDLRLLDEDKINILNKTKFEGLLHFAFDDLKDEKEIRKGLSIIRKIKHPKQIFVLVGFPDYRGIDKTDIQRCEILREYKVDPFIMVYNRVRYAKDPKMKELNQFERMVNRSFVWRKQGFQKSWDEYPYRRKL